MVKYNLNLYSFLQLLTLCYFTAIVVANPPSPTSDAEIVSSLRPLQPKYNEGSGNSEFSWATELLQRVLSFLFKPMESNPMKSESPQLSQSTISDDHNQLRNQGVRNQNLQTIYTDITFDGFGIQSRQSEKCIDIYQGYTNNGIKPAIWTCNEQSNQKFSFAFKTRTAATERDVPFEACLVIPSLCGQKISVPGVSYFQIIAQVSGKCLDVANGATGDNSDVIQTDCLKATDMSMDNEQLWYKKWWMNDVGLTYVSLVSAKSGKCLTVFEGKEDNGQVLNIYTCDEGNNQLWKFY